MLNLLVSIKQVPDTTNIRINPETGTLIREGVPAIINPYDISALALACNLKKTYGGKITVITMGPPQARLALKEALEYFADRIILLTDRKFAGADTLATSYTLAEAIKFLEKTDRPFDLYLFGKQAIDGDTAQVGPGVAARLNVPVITYTIKIEELDLEKRKIVVQRKTEKGIEILSAKLPVLLTCEKEAGHPVFSPLSAILQAQKAEPEVFGADGRIPYDLNRLGLKGSPTRVHRVYTPELKKQGKMINLDEVGVEAAVEEIIKLFKAKGVL